MSAAIRRPTESDIPEMIRLWREMMSFHAQCDDRFRPKPSPDAEEAWEAYLREDILPADRWCVYVATEGELLIGQILGEVRKLAPVWEPSTYGYVTDIVVLPEARRRGTGTALFEALAECFRKRGASHVRLQVLENNPVSQAFWRAMGCSDYSDTLWYDL